ncbi:MAG: hypothetical protein QGD90_09535 [Candidatus Hydrogenedentes bacterium]|nr:hypothetical protein [Candidatus Hydrogenedentota bacterium]
MGDRDRQPAKSDRSWLAGLVARLRKPLFLPLAALMLITVALVPPRGEFPLNDDWIYAKTVQGILETGAYEANPYADPTLIAQAYWGALFCSVFGYSFTVLRASTLVLCLLGAWAAALCVRSRGMPHAAALFFGALFIANPIVMNLSYTFMTDVPFLAVSTISGLFFLKSLEKEAALYVLLGSVAAVAAFFIRQFGLLLPAAFAATWIVLLIRKRVGFSWGVPLALLMPWAVAGGLLLVLPELGAGTGEDWDWSDLGYTTLERARTVLGHVLIGSVYVSLFTLPLLLGRLWPAGETKRWGRRRILGFTAITVLVSYFVILPKPHRLPLMGNSIYDLGVGPMLLRGSVIDSEIAAPLWLGWAWWIITALCIIASALFILECLPHALRALSRKREGRIEDCERAAGQDLFLFFWGLAMLLILAAPAIPIRFDRYFIIALLPWGLLSLQYAKVGVKKGPTVAAVSALAIMYVFSVVCLQDYMAWNGARWRGLERLMTEYGATPEEIDGGYEFNGLYTSDKFAEDSASGGQRNFGPRGWWLVDDLYAVSLYPRDNFEEDGTEPYFSWLGFQTRDVLLLRRTGEPDSLF